MYLFFLFPFGWNFCPQVLPNQSICISYLLVFNNCNYTLLIWKCSPSLSDNTGIRVCPRNFRNSSLFTVTCKISVFSMCFCCQPCVQRPDIFRKPITYLLTPCCTVLLEKLTGLQLVKKFPAFHGTRKFITAHSQASANCPYPGPIQSSPHTHIPPPGDPS